MTAVGQTLALNTRPARAGDNHAITFPLRYGRTAGRRT